MSIEEQLEESKYVYLSKFIDKEKCDDLTYRVKSTIDQGFRFSDPQCPKSYAFPNAEIFNALLLELMPKIEELSNKKLFPTYSYARLYLSGEELKNHLDREACEISVTITLGFDGDVWPIYMGDDIDKSNPKKICMEVGDAVLYKGAEKYHWREVYTEGNWQAQVFLHYVDANGKYADHKYDKRVSLNI